MKIIREIKWFFQRGKKGWADCDSWELRSHFSRMMIKALRDIQGGYGCPHEFYNSKNTNNECQGWHDTLEEMAQGFEAVLFMDEHKYQKWVPSEHGHKLELDYTAMKNAQKKAENGLKLFAKHYQNLWD